MTHRIKFLALIISLGFYNVCAQDVEREGLLGDQFSLENALEAFKNAPSLEAFEKAINEKDNSIHNLDLNNDNEVDYITVQDETDGQAHAIVLSVLVAKNETQDVAVIEIEKTGDGSAQLQIIGDPDFYGEDMIVEPIELEGSSTSSGPSDAYVFKKVVVNVWLWPSVRFLYHPGYVVYRSPWRWHHYPRWWNPWRPLAWTVWHPLRVRHAPRYHVSNVHRVSVAHNIYAPKRRTSQTVGRVHGTKITHARSINKSNRKSVTVTRSTKVTMRGNNQNRSIKKTNQTTRVKRKGSGTTTVRKNKTTKKKGNKKVVKKKKTVKRKKKR